MSARMFSGYAADVCQDMLRTAPVFTQVFKENESPLNYPVSAEKEVNRVFPPQLYKSQQYSSLSESVISGCKVYQIICEPYAGDRFEHSVPHTPSRLEWLFD